MYQRYGKNPLTYSFAYHLSMWNGQYRTSCTWNNICEKFSTMKNISTVVQSIILGIPNFTFGPIHRLFLHTVLLFEFGISRSKTNAVDVDYFGSLFDSYGISVSVSLYHPLSDNAFCMCIFSPKSYLHRIVLRKRKRRTTGRN